MIKLCLLIINNFLISLQFHFCEIFVSHNKAFRVVEYSAIPPLHHSIEWRNPVELNVSYFGPCSLRKFRACLHGGGGPQVGEVTRLSI